MKNEKDSKVEIEQSSFHIEQFIQKKQEESEALQKLLKALEDEQEKQIRKINN